jgi:hypothetical protein
MPEVELQKKRWDRSYVHAGRVACIGGAWRVNARTQVTRCVQRAAGACMRTRASRHRSEIRDHVLVALAQQAIQ